MNHEARIMNRLYIDTRDSDKILVRLKTNEDTFEEQAEARQEKAQAALPMIEKVLKAANLQISDIEEINVEAGPGSFTGVRVGVAIANALAFSLNVKINGKRLGQLETPKY